MPWIRPLPFSFHIDAMDILWKAHLEWFQTPFEKMKPAIEVDLSIPVGDHPGSFGYVRQHHTHEGVDLYAPPNTPVSAVEEGVVVAILDFTGSKAGSPWWNETKAVMIEGPSGVVNLGELNPIPNLRVGQKVQAGDLIGHLTPVLQKFKGRPQTMLHLELYEPGQRVALEWTHGVKPTSLLDPTEYLLFFTNSQRNQS